MTNKSAYVDAIKETVLQAQGREAQLQNILSSCWKLTEKELPPIEYVNIIGSDTYDHFKNTMCGTFSELMRRFKLTSDSNILDIGSGCGRLSYPFNFLMKEGRYYGVDTWRDGVTWCADRFTSKNPNLQFHCMESNNNYYFEDYKEDVRNDYHFPFIADETVDLTFAISCFSHLVENDCRSYFKEIARILKPTGSAYITGFVIDRFFFDYVKRTGKHTGVQEKDPGCYYAYSGQDFFGGFSFEKWRSMLNDCGLEIVSYEVGDWAEKPGALNYQDIFIVSKM